MARAVVAGNWKMNTSVAEAKALASELRESIGFMEDVERVLCPPFPYLPLVREIMTGSSIAVGAQNMSQHEKGAFTGEVLADHGLRSCAPTSSSATRSGARCTARPTRPST